MLRNGSNNHRCRACKHVNREIRGQRRSAISTGNLAERIHEGSDRHEGTIVAAMAVTIPT